MTTDDGPPIGLASTLPAVGTASAGQPDVASMLDGSVCLRRRTAMGEWEEGLGLEIFSGLILGAEHWLSSEVEIRRIGDVGWQPAAPLELHAGDGLVDLTSGADKLGFLSTAPCREGVLPPRWGALSTGPTLDISSDAGSRGMWAPQLGDDGLTSRLIELVLVDPGDEQPPTDLGQGFVRVHLGPSSDSPAGSDAGLVIGAPVVSAGRLVGVVTEVFAQSSQASVVEASGLMEVLCGQDLLDSMWEADLPSGGGGFSGGAVGLGDALCLVEVSDRLAQVGAEGAAVAMMEWALVNLRSLAEPGHEVACAELAFAARRHGALLRALGQPEEAVEVFGEAVLLLREGADEDPDLYCHDLAAGLGDLAGGLEVCGRSEEALAASEEAVHVHQSLAKVDPASHFAGLGAALHRHGVLLAAAGVVEEALDAAEGAVEVARQCCDGSSLHSEIDLGVALSGLGARLCDAGRPRSALDPARESVEILRSAYEGHSVARLDDLVRCEIVCALNLHRAGELSEAVATSRQAVLHAAELLKFSAEHVTLAGAVLRDHLSLAEGFAETPDPCLTDAIGQIASGVADG